MVNIYRKLSFIFMLLLSCNCILAQIKVYPLNKVHIGPIWSSSFLGQTDEALYVNGGINITCLPAASGFSFIKYAYIANGITYDLPSLIPQWPSSMLIGTPSAPLFELHSSYIYSLNGAVYALSDSGYKINFRETELDSNYFRIKQLNTYKYDYNVSKILKDSAMKDSIPFQYATTNQVGFKAQEIMMLYPHLVHQDVATGKYYVNYMGLIPILTEAIKKQSEEIDILRSRLDELEKD